MGRSRAYLRYSEFTLNVSLERSIKVFKAYCELEAYIYINKAYHNALRAYVVRAVGVL